MSNGPLTPGLAIENKPQEVGALGCFARRRAGGEVVLLSNAHVLFGHVPEQQNVRIYHPPSNSSCCRKRHIANTMLTWAQGFNSVTFRVDDLDPPLNTGSETDCAIARLQPGVAYDNTVPGDIGMITGTPPPGDLGVVAGPPFGTAPTAEQYVKFFSPVTGRVHYGTILTHPASQSAVYTSGGSGPLSPLLWGHRVSDSLDPIADAMPNVGQFLVMPRPGPGGSYDAYTGRGTARLYFGSRGDSGSVVLNHANQVIGLLCRAGPKPEISTNAQEWLAVGGIGIVNPIHKVLDRLDIDIPPNFSGTVPTAGATAVYMPGADPDEIAVERGRERIEALLSQTRMGRFLLAKLRQHRVEARRIVLGKRQVLVAWHRHQGPALVQHFLENLRDPSHAVPTHINGVERARLITVMADLFERYGSPKLKRDVARYRALALRFGPQVTHLDQLPALIEQIRQERMGP